VPLAQAVEGVYIDSSNSNRNNNNKCIIFVRYKQGSWTARYVGGTAEGLWAYCDNQTNAVHLTSDYHGTSKNPQTAIYNNNKQQQPYLLFLSDRSDDGTVGPKVFQSDHQKWRATTMNLFAAPLPTEQDMYDNNHQPNKPFVLQNVVQLTAASCQFHGWAVREYAVDPVTGHVVLRIGADLFQLTRQQIETTLNNNNIATPTLLPVAVRSDLHERQERHIAVDLGKHVTAVDVFDTHFDTVAALLTLRGQVWVAPVAADGDSSSNDHAPFPYQGAGQNMPPRRYRVVPGSMTGGATRVLAALNVPLYDISNNNDNNDKLRLALILATDPLSDTAEHAFYLVQVQADAVNAFQSLQHWPRPFVGGHVSGGSTRDGGLGTVRHDSLTVSPCGRRFAWSDTDDRICVMTVPIYNNTDSSSSPASFQCLPQHNDRGEPMAGTVSELSWSPGGRYLAVQHNALNQFTVISIVDCGNPAAADDDDDDPAGRVADLQIGVIAQVTPSRFNSFSVFWGKSTFDIFLHQTLLALTKELGLPEPDDVATTLYFASDRDVMSDVHSVRSVDCRVCAVVVSLARGCFSHSHILYICCLLPFFSPGEVAPRCRTLRSYKATFTHCRCRRKC